MSARDTVKWRILRQFAPGLSPADTGPKAGTPGSLVAARMQATVGAGCRCAALSRLTVVLLAAVVLSMPARNAWAIPAFARQTGLRCNACHTAFPELTPTGRDFKLNGYVTGGHAGAWYGHFAGMLIPSFTHTDKDQPEPPAEHFGENNNLALEQASLFYGGKLVDHLGVFAQLTFSGIDRALAWDNVDLRFANTALIGGRPLTYGITLNNNPGVQDLWNTVPAWSFPFISPGLGPAPAASTLIEEALGQQVAGLGGYVMFNRLIYLELSGYRTLGARTQRILGVSTEGEDKIDGIAPYWRVALEHNWGRHSLEVGSFGLDAHTFPGRDESSGSDYRTDIALDAQYQYLGNVHGLSFQTSWIHERQHWDASLPLGNTSNAEDTLRTFKARVAYIYDKTYRVNLGYFNIDGDSDPALYADSPTGSPDSSGWIIQLDYMPFHKTTGPSLWPWLNVQFTLQYTIYDRFNGARHNIDGAGRDASDNNTLFLAAWIAF